MQIPVLPGNQVLTWNYISICKAGKFLRFGKTFPTKRLIQGDVGSGKTIIAAIASLYSTSSKLQVAFLVPTEILADQHTKTFKNIFSNLPINISCLKSKLQPKEKKLILSSVAEGKIDILIGTHSLIEKNVVFRRVAGDRLN